MGALMTCLKCRQRNLDGSKFCGKCGTPVVDDEASATRGWASRSGTAPLTLDDGNSDFQSTASKRRRLVLMACGLAALAIAAIGFVVTRSRSTEAKLDSTAAAAPNQASVLAPAAAPTPEAFETWSPPP